MKVDNFKYEVGDKVVLVGGENGLIIGRASYLESTNSYLIRYLMGYNKLTEQWWQESAIIGVSA